ncbi:MAG: type 1 glutamine amidotransferase [Alphaproteobacteria bacterium]|nr:MAG: type 1 glutamine amidotransferase [Alphaproteobacteria bacterium]
MQEDPVARLLMMEGNTLARQREASALGVRSASGVYIDAIRAHFPDMAIDVIHAADRGQHLKPGMAFTDYDGLVIGGSGLHAYDTSFEVTNQIELLKAFAETGRPILGSCWGLQIAVIAAGGTVTRNPNGREIGFARKILLTEEGRAHPYFAGKPTTFDAPCIHYDEITQLPANATLLCTNSHSAVQGAVVPVGRSQVWAVQYHPEFDLAQISMLIALYGADMIEQGFFADENDRMQYKAKIDALAANPGDKALAWQLALDSDILDDGIRRAEIINWMRTCILRQA